MKDIETKPGIEGAAMEPERRDVIVIGGGPGGAATAAHLARAGLDVLMVEKERHPRFHVGESLLPQSLPLIDRLGLTERLAEIGVHKPGAEFIDADTGKRAVFDFSRSISGGPPAAYQVRRADFDKLVFDRALELGATALQDTTAKVISCDATGAVVETRGPDGVRRHAADWLIDATGRSTLMANANREKSPDPRNHSAALFGHFRGVPRAEGPEGGNIRIHLTKPGWVWQIPLPDGETSVGWVAPSDVLAARDCGVEEFFRRHAARNPTVAALLENAEHVRPMGATGNFSYRARTAGGPGHLKVGDAFGFIDPIFSTGVHLALGSAESATDLILAARRAPKERERLIARYDKGMHRRLDYVAWFIYRIHDETMRELLLNPKDVLGIERAVIALLAGDFSWDLRIRARVWIFKMIWQLAGAGLLGSRNNA